MPTSRPRHTITETPPVQEALDRLRAQTGSRKLDFAELVVLGAREKERQLLHRDLTAREARHQLGDMIRTGTLPEPDPSAAAAVKRLGLIDER